MHIQQKEASACAAARCHVKIQSKLGIPSFYNVVAFSSHASLKEIYVSSDDIDHEASGS